MFDGTLYTDHRNVPCTSVLTEEQTCSDGTLYTDHRQVPCTSVLTKEQTCSVVDPEHKIFPIDRLYIYGKFLCTSVLSKEQRSSDESNPLLNAEHNTKVF